MGAGPTHDSASPSNSEPRDVAEDPAVDRGSHGQQPAGQPSLAEARQLLDEEHYGLDKVSTKSVVPPQGFLHSL